MAFLKDIQLDNGLEIKKSYARVDSLNGNKEAIMFSVNYYLTKEDFINGKSYLKQEIYYFKPTLGESNSNIFEEIYEFLKNEESFKNAVNC